jgi:hypothetical protein
VDLRRDVQATGPGEVLNPDLPPFNLPGGGNGPSLDRTDQTPVLVDLLKQVPPLLSEHPEDILGLFVRLGEIHVLGLVEDRTFITQILPLVPRGLLQFLAGCLRDQCSWALCKARVLEEYFPHFVRERLIRTLIVFNFHQKRKSVRTFIDQVFQAAGFLLYEATEPQLVERVVMNLHPDILKEAAFLDKPCSREELIRVVNLIEERFSVARERQKLEQVENGSDRSEHFSGGFQRRTHTQVVRNIKCWNCGRMGHVQNRCPSKELDKTNSLPLITFIWKPF